MLICSKCHGISAKVDEFHFLLNENMLLLSCTINAKKQKVNIWRKF